MALADIPSLVALSLNAAKNWPISISWPGLWLCGWYVTIELFSGNSDVDAVDPQPHSYLGHLNCLEP